MLSLVGEYYEAANPIPSPLWWQMFDSRLSFSRPKLLSLTVGDPLLGQGGERPKHPLKKGFDIEMAAESEAS